MAAVASGAGAPPPSGGGGGKKQPSSRPNHQGHGDVHRSTNGCEWTKDCKTKTCKCEYCGDKVKTYSWNCNRCKRYICSECFEQEDHKSEFNRAAAKDNVEEGCWAHKFRGGINPKFAHLLRAPPRRDNETLKVLLASSLRAPSDRANSSPALQDQIAKKKAQETMAKNKRKAGTPTSDENESPPKKSRQTADSGKLPASGLRNGTDREGTTEDASSPQPHVLDGGHTVIVGGGIIGLFVAWELACRFQKKGLRHSISVIEVCDRVGKLASGSCHGVLSTYGMPDGQEWAELRAKAVDGWNALREMSSAQGINFQTGNEFVLRSRGHSGAVNRPFPPWLVAAQGATIARDRAAIGRVDPVRLIRFLRDECINRGVRLEYNRTPKTVYEDESGKVTGVLIGGPDPRDNSSNTKLKCENVVFATGPYTTSLVHKLFEDDQLTLEHSRQRRVWLEIPSKHVSFPAGDSLKIDSTDDWSDGILTMVGRPDIGIVEVSAAERRTRDSRVGIERILAPRTHDSTALRDLVNPYFTIDVRNTTRVPSGAGEICLAEGSQPCIAGTTLPRESEEEENMSGIWLCYGFGSYGTTLAPGAARHMVDRLFDEE